MKPSDNEIEMLAAGFAIQHKNGLIRFAYALLEKYPSARASTVAGEAQPSRQTLLDAIWRHGNARAMAEHNIAYRDEVRNTADALIALFDATPQASVEYERGHADGWAAGWDQAIKQPQADKDGGQQRNWVSDWSAAIKSLPMGRSAAAVDKSPNLQGSSVDRSADLQGGGDDVVLPPLPSPPVHRGHALFAGSQMQTYARAAVLADRQQRAGDELAHLRAEIQRLRNGVDQDMAEVGRLQALYDSEWRKRQKLRAAFDHPVFAFLLGEGQLHGVDFGERAPGAVGKWWWRKDLRAALSATQAEQGERDA